MDLLWLAPAYYKVFKTLEPAYTSFWDAAVTKGYQIIAAADKNNNSLVPDWCDASGNYSSLANAYEGQGKNFIYDAVRTPFRSAIDVLWFGLTLNKLGFNSDLDISTVPYVSIKLRSTAAVNTGVGANGTFGTIVKGVATGGTTNRQYFSIAANRDTIIYCDFSTLSSKQDWQLNIVDFAKIHGIEF